MGGLTAVLRAEVDWDSSQCVSKVTGMPRFMSQSDHVRSNIRPTTTEANCLKVSGISLIYLFSWPLELRLISAQQRAVIYYSSPLRNNIVSEILQHHSGDF